MRFEERRIAGLTVRIDRTLCVGFGDCVEVAPLAFELDEENVAVFLPGAADLDRERLRAACDACPVDAISAWDADDRRLFP
jgi:ferredoxin